MFKPSFLLTIFAALLLSVSCSSEADVDTSLSSGNEMVKRVYKAGFTIMLDGDNSLSRLASRAPGEGYEAGSMPENYINLSDIDFRVFLFDKNDEYVTSLNDIAIQVVDVTGNMKRYQVNGSVTKESVDKIDGQLKVMMLANWHHSYPQPVVGMPLSKIATSAQAIFEFDYNGDQNVGFDRPIPMFGVSDLITGLEFSPGWNTDLGTLHMLRAYAKVRVRAAAESLPITSVQLTRGNRLGYCAPIGVSCQSDYVHGRYDRDYWRIPSIPADATVKTDIDFVNISGEWTLYVPEFVNLDTDASGNPDPRNPLEASQRARIKVTFDGHTRPEYVDFMYYDTPPSYAGGDAKVGDYFDLLRNTVYDFTLCKLIGDAKLEVEVDIQPYAEQVLKPDFGLMRDEQGDLMIKPEKNSEGKDSLPEFFIQYLEQNNKELPFPLESLVEGDYYAIHRGQDGLMANAEIWLKDIDGAHVLENFRPVDETDDNCSTRKVELYFGLDKYEFHKDRFGDRRLAHYSNHWTVVLDRKDFTVFKSPDNTERYEVESFDKDNPKELFIVANPSEDDDYYYFIKVVDGVITDEKVSVPKKETEETE